MGVGRLESGHKPSNRSVRNDFGVVNCGVCQTYFTVEEADKYSQFLHPDNGSLGE